MTDNELLFWRIGNEECCGSMFILPIQYLNCSLHLIPSCFSIIGSTTIIFCYLYFKSLRTFFLRLAVYLSLSDIGLMLSFMLLAVWKDFCIVQAGMSEFFPLASALWTYCISFTLLQNLVKLRSMEDIAKCEIPMSIVCWGIPLILSILVMALRWDQQLLSWCWINDTNRQWRFLFLYWALFLIFVVNLIA